ncbi:MAG TPA: DNA-binding protein, partial [Cytophagales bacterium]|nr:DNA-binding protein [Cytophagales bacterium]
RYKDDGYFYEKHKVFLYKEDFNKFIEALNNTVNHVKTELLPEVDFAQFDRSNEEEKETEDTNLGSNLKWD